MMSDTEVRQLLEAFGRAWNEHDLDAALALTTEDCAFESTGPAPDGIRSEGRDAVRRAWEPIFANTAAHFDGEELIIDGDRVVQCWTYTWGDGHVRGVDVFRLRNGKVAEKLSYVKG
jgi:uncharacterized protein (TIGR02246 family)